MSINKKWMITIGITLAIWFAPMPAGLKPQAWQLFALFVGTITGFILQPLPIASISFIAITITALLKVLTPAQALSGFSNGTIWLIVSAVLFSTGFIKTGLGRRVAFTLIEKIGDSTLKVTGAIIISDLILAPATPSNTARVGGVLYPIMRSLTSAFGSEPDSDESRKKFGAFLMQAVYNADAAVCAMFMTAVANNPISVILAKQTANVELSWGLWALAASVPGVISLIVVTLVLYKIYPPTLKKIPEAKGLARKELADMGAMAKEEKIVILCFIGALVLWATSGITKIDATLVAMLAVSVMLFTQVLNANDILGAKTAWDTLIWMGVLVGMANFLGSLGFIPWFSKAVAGMLGGVSWMVALTILLIVYMYSHYGFASLSAHVSAMYAPFLAVAIAAGAPPYFAALTLAMVASLCLTLTHYGTGTSPILFGSGYVTQTEWWRNGFIVSVINLVIWVGVGGAWWKVLGLW